MSAHGPDYGTLLKILVPILVLGLVFWLTPWGLYVVVGAIGMTLLVVVCLFLVVTVNLCRVLFKNLASPRRIVPAVAVRKWTREYDYDLPTRPLSAHGITDRVQRVIPWLPGPTETVYEDWVFWVSFLIRGTELEFCVPEQVYVGIEEGNAGTLCQKGEHFLWFHPDSRTGQPS